MTPEDQLRQFVADGDQPAFASVVTHFTPLVYGLALRRSGRSDLAAEIAQDVFLACARKASVLVENRSPLGPWLHRTTLLESMNHLRKEATHRRRVEAVAATAVASSGRPEEDETDWAAARPHLDEALNSLGANDRAAVLLRFYEGRSFAEIGAAIGRSEEAARKVCHRAVESLSRLLRRRGLVVPVSAVTAMVQAHFAPAAAAVPLGLPAGLAASVAAQLGGPLAVAGGAGSLTGLILTMKSTPVLLTALAVLLIAVPAGWQWRQLRLARVQAATATSSEPAASAPTIDPQPPPPRPVGAIVPGAANGANPGSQEIRKVIERIVQLRRGNAQGDFDMAAVMEIEQLSRLLLGWPAPAVREAIEVLLTTTGGGRARLEVLEGILSGVYATKSPAEAARLALPLVKQDPMFRESALWSVAQWFRDAPAEAAAWVNEQESSGGLEGAGVEDLSRKVVAQGRLLGQVLADPSAAPGIVAASDPATAQGAMRLWAGRLAAADDPSAFLQATAAIADPALAGNVIGNWAKAGMNPGGDVAADAQRLVDRLPADLPADVRRAALIEGAQWGGVESSLAVLARAAAPDDRVDSLAEMTRQFLVGGSGAPEAAWLEANSDLQPYHDEVAAAAALAFGSPEFIHAAQDPAVATRWLDQIRDDSTKERTAARLRHP